jgi:hypothetical protein
MHSFNRQNTDSLGKLSYLCGLFHNNYLLFIDPLQRTGILLVNVNFTWALINFFAK